MQKGRTTEGVASAQVRRFLRAGIADAKAESRKIAPDWFSLGMIDSSTVKLTASGADVCLEPDSELGTLLFKLRRVRDGGYLITRVAKVKGDTECERGAFLTPPEQIPASPQ